VLNQFGVVHQILLVRLTKVRQQNYDAQNLEDIDDFYALWILHLEQLVQAFAIISWIQQEGLSSKLTELLFPQQIGEIEIFLNDVLNGLVELKWRSK
jgi:hypothetical protein